MDKQKKLPMVLIIEDDFDLMEAYKIQLDRAFVVMMASSCAVAEAMFQEFRQELFAVVFDGNLPGETTIRLAQQIAGSGYSGHMVANSNNQDLQRQLLAYCRHGHKGLRELPKAALPDLLLGLR